MKGQPKRSGLDGSLFDLQDQLDSVAITVNALRQYLIG